MAVLLAARAAIFAVVRAAGGPLSFFIDPIATFDRLRYAQLWAKSPLLVPGDEFGWLPLPGYLYGALLRLNADPFLLPVLLNAAASMAVVALVYLVARELFGRPAAVAAAFAAAFSAAAVAEGLEPDADCLMQLFLLPALWLWIRHAKTGQARLLWAAAACLALGNATRFEAWAVSVAFAAYCHLKAKRRAPLLLVGAVPAFWLALGLYARGDALAFVHAILPFAFFGGPPTGFGERYLQLFWAFVTSDQFLVLALAILALPACLSDAAALWFLAAGAAAAAFFLTANLGITASVAMHTWFFYLLAFPLAGAGVVKLWNAMGRGRWLLAAIPALFVFRSAGALRECLAGGLPVRQKALVEAVDALGALRKAGALLPGDHVLVEIPPDSTSGPFERLWRLVDDPEQVLFDRRPVFTWNPAEKPRRRILDERNNPSIMALPPADLERWLAERSVRLVVTAPPAAMRPPWVRSFSRGGRDFWLRRGDPLLAAAGRP